MPSLLPLTFQRSQLSVDIWIFEEADNRPICSCDPLLYIRLYAGLFGNGSGRFPDFRGQDSGKHSEQFSQRQCNGQHRAPVGCSRDDRDALIITDRNQSLWAEHVDDPTSWSVLALCAAVAITSDAT